MVEQLNPPLVIEIDANITIRTATEGDMPLLEMEGLYSKFRNLFRRAFREQQSGRRMLLVADFNGYPIGRLFMLFHSTDHSVANGSSRAYLYSFFVLQPFRGLGVGTRMVEHAEEILRERRFKYVTIAVAKDNPGALRLYERLDYHIVREDAGRWSYTDHNGRFHQMNEPCWILEKNLTVG